MPLVLGFIAYAGGYFGWNFGLETSTGTVLWWYQTNAEVWSSPSAQGDALFFGSNDRNLYSLGLASGNKRWSIETGGIVNSPIARKDKVFCGSGDFFIYAVDIPSGKSCWRFKTNGSVSSSPTLSENALFCGSDDGCIYAIRL